MSLGAPCATFSPLKKTTLRSYGLWNSDLLSCALFELVYRVRANLTQFAPKRRLLNSLESYRFIPCWTSVHQCVLQTVTRQGHSATFCQERQQEAKVERARRSFYLWHHVSRSKRNQREQGGRLHNAIVVRQGLRVFLLTHCDPTAVGRLHLL